MLDTSMSMGVAHTAGTRLMLLLLLLPLLPMAMPHAERANISHAVRASIMGK